MEGGTGPAQKVQFIFVKVEIPGVAVIVLPAQTAERDDCNVAVSRTHPQKCIAEESLGREGSVTKMLAGIFLSEQRLGIVHIPSVNRISLRIQDEAGIPQALVQIHLVGRVHETRTDSGHDSVVGVHS